jgi:exopolysaccharide production protein ExoQ
MNVYNPSFPSAEAHSPKPIYTSFSVRVGKTANRTDTPVSQQIISWLLFWPLLCLVARQVVYFSGPARSAEVYQNGADMAGARGSHYSLYVYLLFLFGFVLAGYQEVWTTVKKNWVIPAMLGIALSSTLWSATPVGTLQMCFAVGLCTLFACYLSARFTTERFMELFILVGAIAALLSVFFAVALPSYGIFQGYGGGAWQGICAHKNALGISMAFLLTPVFFTNSYGQGRKIIYSALLLFLIYKSQSRGAWVDTAGMLLFVAGLNVVRRFRGRELPPLLLLTSTFGIVALLLGIHYWPELAAAMGKDPSMTGRTGIYAEIWRSAMKRPLLGYGFGGFWYAGNPERQRIAISIGWPSIGYAESGFLELVLQMGFVGLGLVVAMMVKATVQGMRLLRSPSYSPRVGWFLTILFLSLLTNIDAGWFMTSNTMDWVLILMACSGLNAEAQRPPVGVGGDSTCY